MKTISSQAGTRLAKAKAALDQAEAENDGEGMAIAGYDFDQAARAVADELIADNHHSVEGD
ncbi:hypothetical protein [Chromohalobacter canadensis]|uniref:hypothetical protein n=1 Tax=Chromohalobacter canadensis TaxID=141389 RepID=UPI00240F7326|nr:hypothetical protein [Chromohalobacter canadensis]